MEQIGGRLGEILVQFGGLMVLTWGLTQFVGRRIPLPNELVAVAFGELLGITGWAIGLVTIGEGLAVWREVLAVCVFSACAVALTAVLHDRVTGGIEKAKNGTAP